MDTLAAQEATIPFHQFAALRRFLEGHQPLEILRHFLGQPLAGAPPLLDKAIIIGFDMEWWMHEQPSPKPITEVGLTVLRGRDLLSHDPSGSFVDLLSKMETYHVRIIETCHFRNIELAPKAEHNFLFGETRFMHEADAQTVLKDLVQQNAPIILLGHGGADLQSDKERLWKTWKIQLISVGNVVYTMTTGRLAEEAGIQSTDAKGLESILNGFGIHRNKTFEEGKKKKLKREPRWLHNAGNDIAYTTLVALLIGLYPQLFPDFDGGYPVLGMVTDEYHPSTFLEVVQVQDTPMPDILEAFIDLQASKPAPTWGVAAFCFKCEQLDHNYGSECPTEIEKCTFCSVVKGKDNKPIRDKAKDHTFARCSVQYAPDRIKYAKVPDFIENSTLTHLNKLRYKNAVMTVDKETIGEVILELYEHLAPFKIERCVDELVLEDAMKKLALKPKRPDVEHPDASAFVRRGSHPNFREYI